MMASSNTTETFATGTKTGEAFGEIGVENGTSSSAANIERTDLKQTILEESSEVQPDDAVVRAKSSPLPHLPLRESPLKDGQLSPIAVDIGGVDSPDRVLRQNSSEVQDKVDRNSSGYRTPMHINSERRISHAASVLSTVSFTTYWAKTHDKKHVRRPQELERFLMFLLAFLLSFNGGFVNAASISTFATALSHVSGTTTKIGLDIRHAEWDLLELHAGLILSFLCGSFLCGLLIHHKHAKNQQWTGYTGALCTISFLLFLGAGLHKEDVAKYLTAMAMGLQNGLCTHHSGAVIRTTHVTGIVTDIGMLLGQMVVREVAMLPPTQHKPTQPPGGDAPRDLALGRVVDTRRRPSGTTPRAPETPRTKANKANRRALFKLKLLATLFLGFLSGGVVGAYAHYFLEAQSLYFPAAFTGLIALGYSVYNLVILPWMETISFDPSIKNMAKKIKSTIFDQSERDSSDSSSPRDNPTYSGRNFTGPRDAVTGPVCSDGSNRR